MIDKRTAFKLLVYSKNPEPLTRKTEFNTVKKFFIICFDINGYICLTKFLIYIPYFSLPWICWSSLDFSQVDRDYVCHSLASDDTWHLILEGRGVGCYCAANIQFENICYCIYECMCCLCDHAYIHQNLKQLSVSLKTGSVASWISDRCHNILQVIKHKSDQK